MPLTDANTQAVRAVAEQVGIIAAKEAIEQFVAQHPELNKITAEIPAPLKWAATIIGAVLVLVSGSAVLWVVTTISAMQITLARVDERMTMQAPAQETRFVTIEARLTRVEAAGAGHKSPD